MQFQTLSETLLSIGCRASCGKKPQSDQLNGIKAALVSININASNEPHLDIRSLLNRISILEQIPTNKNLLCPKRKQFTLYTSHDQALAEEILALKATLINRYSEQLLVRRLSQLEDELNKASPDIRLVRLLAAEGANPNVTLQGNYPTPLIWAIANHHPDIALKFIEGSNPNTLDRQTQGGNTALFWAITEHQVDVIGSLVEKGINRDLKNRDGDTALMWAINRYHANLSNEILARDYLRIVMILITANQLYPHLPQSNLNKKNNSDNTALMLAAQLKLTNVVQVLLQQEDIDLSVQDKEGQTALTWVIANCPDEKLALALIEKIRHQPDCLDKQTRTGATALLFAVYENQLNRVVALTEAGANRDLVETRGWTALTLAIRNNQEKIALFLIEANQRYPDLKKSNLNAPTMNPPLLCAVQNGRTNVISALLNQPEVRVTVNTDLRFLKCELSKASPNPQIVGMLAAAGASPNVEIPGWNMTPLMWAIKNNHPDIAIAFIQGANSKNLNEATQEGHTPLMEAVLRNQLIVAEALIAAGANLDLQNQEGHTPLMEAVLRNQLNVAEALIAAGAHLDLHNQRGETALMLAILNQNEKIALTLIEKMKPQMRLFYLESNAGESPLTLALFNKQERVVSALLDCGVDPNRKNSYGYTVLTWAIHKKQIDVVRDLILRQGVGAVFAERRIEIDTNVQTPSGDTPLMLAVSSDNDEFSHALFLAESRSGLRMNYNLRKNGPQGQPGAGDTALHIAIRLKKSNIALHLITGMNLSGDRDLGRELLRLVAQERFEDDDQIIDRIGDKLHHEAPPSYYTSLQGEKDIPLPPYTNNNSSSSTEEHKREMA